MATSAVFTFRSKMGSGSFARKLARLVRRGRAAQARFLLRKQERKHGASNWSPGYMLGL
jgi:hypothetical protein